jgi:hypothetical protein
MSADLSIDSVRPIEILSIIPKIRSLLAELLNVNDLPPLVVEKLEAGERLPLDADQIGISGAPLVLLSLRGEPESVAVVSGSDGLMVSVTGQRSIVQYALAVAAAIALARECGAGIWDGRRFFGEEIHTSPETLLQRLRVAGPQDDFRQAARQINWGPAGGP